MWVRSDVTSGRNRRWEWRPDAGDAEDGKTTSDASGRGTRASDAGLIFADVASLILAAVQSLAPTLLPFSTSLTSSLRCLACGVEGAEGALFLPMPGALDALLLLVRTSLKPSVFMPAAAMADQASFFFSLTTSLSLLGAGAMVGFRTGTRGGFGAVALGDATRGFWGGGLFCLGGGIDWFLAFVKEAIMRVSISNIVFSMLSSMTAM